jgi:glycosyltransferase involved in cell wall biosynthesis
MTHIVSVITPVSPMAASYLPEAYESLVAQELPDGWDWEWLLQEDGEAGSVQKLVPENDLRIRFGIGRAGGPSVARNLALARARGSLVKVLDADDMLCPGTIDRDIQILSEYSDVTWTTSRVIDLLPDGSTMGFDYDPPEGRLIGTDVLDHWRDHDYRASVHPATLCVRREYLLALGGWMALPASGDTGLLISLSVVSNGYFVSEAGLYYRKWPGQKTGQARHADPAERMARMRLIQDRAGALLQLVGPTRDMGNPSVAGSTPAATAAVAACEPPAQDRVDQRLR